MGIKAPVDLDVIYRPIEAEMARLAAAGGAGKGGGKGGKGGKRRGKR